MTISRRAKCLHLVWWVAVAGLAALPAWANDPPPAVAHQHWIAAVDITDLDAHVIHILETPAPSQTYPEPWESWAWVGPTTSATFTLSYVGADDYLHQVVATVQIDNATGQLLPRPIDPTPPSTLGDLFGNLPAAPAPDTDAVVQIDLDQPVYLELEETTAYQITVYVTDTGWPVGARDRGHYDVTQQEANLHLLNWGLSDKVLQVAPPTPTYNCHGWTFTGGEKWINGHEQYLDEGGGLWVYDHFERILNDNGYTHVWAGQVAVGDLVVYRDPFGNIQHSGIVTAVDGAGNATQIESKWGCLGLYRHAPLDVAPGYGQPEYWRTDRPNGHQLDKATPARFLLWLLLLLMWLLAWAV